MFPIIRRMELEEKKKDNQISSSEFNIVPDQIYSYRILVM